MAVENLKGSRIMAGLLPTNGAPAAMAPPGLAGGRVHVWSETVEVTAAASDTSTYHMARLPSNARILGISRISYDDMSSTTTPTGDIGIYPINSEFTADVDAINDGLDLSTAAVTGAAFIKLIANYGKRLWEFINGVTVDPQCMVDIKIVLDDADVNEGGTFMVEIFFVLD